MARKYNIMQSTGQYILLVDDNLEYLEATRIILKTEGHEVFTSNNGEDALKKVKENHIDLILLDFFMPKMTGEEVVKEIRKFNKQIQIILQTGYTSDNPPRDLLQKLDIQGYYDKSEGIEKFLLWVDVGLKHAQYLQKLNKSKMGMNYILNITPRLHKIQPVEDLFQCILFHISGLLGADNSFLAVLPPYDQMINPENVHDGFLAIFKDDSGLQIHAGTGKFEGRPTIEEILGSIEITNIEKCLQEKIFIHNNKSFIIPLTVGENPIGVIYLDELINMKEDIDLLNIFANQAAVAIQNSILYEMAAFDPLTEVYTRKFFFQLMLKELRSTFRNNLPISMLMVDIDNLKIINDTKGHLAGDKVLSLMGNVLRKSTRASDIIGRYGGDEFAIILPRTDQSKASIVAEKILGNMHTESNKNNGLIKLNGSIGICTLNSKEKIPDCTIKVPNSYFQSMAKKIVETVDKMLYQAKHDGKGCCRFTDPVEWLSPDLFKKN